MTEILQAIQDSDARALAVEKARENVEAAKNALELAKSALETAREQFDDSLARGEELGLPKAKMKKLIEERTAALVASGLVPTQIEAAAKPRAPKPAKKKGLEAVPPANDESVNEEPTSEIEFNDSEETALAAMSAH